MKIVHYKVLVGGPIQELSKAPNWGPPGRHAGWPIESMVEDLLYDLLYDWFDDLPDTVDDPLDDPLDVLSDN